MQNRNILCVDDELNILLGFKRHLRKEFDLTLAVGAERAIEALNSGVKFAVIISDMKMPGMDGIQLLSKAQEISPNSVRMMLTGMGDQQTAITAVNEGNIFRFLNKPCSPEKLADALNAGIRQYELIMAEKILLQDTLKGSVKVLVDVLATTSPVAFSRAIRIKKMVIPIVQYFKLKNGWSYEVAAMLSQIGCVTIPVDVIEKYYHGEHLTLAEKKMINNHPKIGKKLISNIPRLDIIADIIEGQNQDYNKKIIYFNDDNFDEVAFGTQVLRIISDFDLFLLQGNTKTEIMDLFRQQTKAYNPVIIDALSTIIGLKDTRTTKKVKLKALEIGMVVAQDLRLNNVLLIAKEQEINETILQRLENLWLQDRINEQDSIAIY